jgi:hypothetical protein
LTEPHDSRCHRASGDRHGVALSSAGVECAGV